MKQVNNGKCKDRRGKLSGNRKNLVREDGGFGLER